MEIVAAGRSPRIRIAAFSSADPPVFVSDNAGADLLALDGAHKRAAEVGKLLADDAADIVPFLTSGSARWATGDTAVVGGGSKL
jgi:hypothetical protein